MSSSKMKSLRLELALSVMLLGCGAATETETALRASGCPETEAEQLRVCDMRSQPSTFECTGAHVYETFENRRCVYASGMLVGSSDGGSLVGNARPDGCVFKRLCDPENCTPNPDLPAPCYSLATYSTRCQAALEAQVASRCSADAQSLPIISLYACAQGVSVWSDSYIFGGDACVYADGTLVGAYSAGDHVGLEQGAGNWNFSNCVRAPPCS